MKTHAGKAAAWIYQGLWGVLVDWFRVPHDPPTLPAAHGERVESFQPAPAFLTYLKFWFVLALASPNAALTVGYLAIAGGLVAAGLWWIAAVLLLVVILLMLAAAIPWYIGVCLRYDTTWYVMSERSMRIRSGIWVIQETTITFENVQNVKVTQGPLQRYLGIANVLVDTAGGSSDGKQKSGAGHHGLIEGVTTADAARLREMILSKVRHSSSAGLGDEEHHRPAAASGAGAWSPQHLTLLREIRNNLATWKAAG